jgi:hypothetical protein
VGDDRVPDAIRDESTGPWISKAEVAEVPFTAFRSRKKAERIDGRLVVRRIPDLNPTRVEQPTLFDTYRHHAFFTTTAKKRWARWSRTRPTALTRSSSKSTPTSNKGPSLTSRPGCSPRTAPGSCSP